MYINIYGRFIAGEENAPFEGCLDIILVGEHSTPEYGKLYERSGLELGAKAMGRQIISLLIPGFRKSSPYQNICARIVKIVPEIQIDQIEERNVYFIGITFLRLGIKFLKD